MRSSNESSPERISQEPRLTDAARTIAAALLRRWTVIVVLAAVGAAAGGLLAFVTPRLYRSDTVVFVGDSAQSPEFGGSTVAPEVGAQRMADTFGRAIAPQQVHSGSLIIFALGPTGLQVQAFAPSAQAAEKLSYRVARAVVDKASVSVRARRRLLLERRARLAAIARAQMKLLKASPPGDQGANWQSRVAMLDIGFRLEDNNWAVTQALLDLKAGSPRLDGPTEPARLARPMRRIYVLLGIALGLVVGSIIALLLEDRRRTNSSG